VSDEPIVDTIHILFAGAAIGGCFHGLGFPSEWPAKHSWVPMDQLGLANCPSCVTAALNTSPKDLVAQIDVARIDASKPSPLPNTLATNTRTAATTQWPSGKHVANFTVRDGALVVAVDFKGLTDEALEGLIASAQRELESRRKWKP